MIREYAMNSERVLCRADKTLETAQYVADGLKDDIRDYLPCLALNISLKNKTIAGVLINDIRPLRDCWLTIYSTSERWATRSVIRYVFFVVFCVIGAQRCSVFISESNKKSFDMCVRLGFQKEGMLRKYRENGENCYVMGMLKNECLWIKEKQNEQK